MHSLRSFPNKKFMAWFPRCAGPLFPFLPTSPKVFDAGGKPDKARFLNIAEGSLEESRYYLILAQDLGYGDARKLLAQLEDVSRLLSRYAAAIASSDS
jgi:23S rRNA-intervening sequence protein